MAVVPRFAIAAAALCVLIEIGVDGIISDHPDILRKVAGEKGIALPKGSPVSP